MCSMHMVKRLTKLPAKKANKCTAMFIFSPSQILELLRDMEDMPTHHGGVVQQAEVTDSNGGIQTSPGCLKAAASISCSDLG